MIANTRLAIWRACGSRNSADRCNCPCAITSRMALTLLFEDPDRRQRSVLRPDRASMLLLESRVFPAYAKTAFSRGRCFAQFNPEQRAAPRRVAQKWRVCVEP
jgi:hypothetical protein